MPRTARKKSESGIYHVILRGINRQTIFKDNEDYAKFLYKLEDCRQKSCHQLYAYCLMSNHVHLLIKEGIEDLGTTMRRLGASYVYWYNHKYERTGHLFQDRYKSEPVENDRYLLTVLRYIHYNPVKAGITKHPGDYTWSSYKEYTGKNIFVDKKFILDLFSTHPHKAIESFQEFHAIMPEDECLEIVEEKKYWSDAQARKIIHEFYAAHNIDNIKALSSQEKKDFIKMLHNQGLSTRQIERLTGINRKIIYNK